MLELYGKEYYIDIDSVTERCQITETIEEENGDTYEDRGSLNIFKYELLKMCIEKVLNDYEDVDEELGVFSANKTSASFKLAFNTLLKNQIIKEEDE